MENLIGSLGRAVMEGEPEVAEESAKAALRAGLDPIRALEEGLLTAIRKVGEGFGTGDVFLPELILAANACKAGASVLVEEIRKAGGDWKPVGTLVIGTVSGDIHDIGKTLVATLFEASGFNVVDLGVNIEPEGFVEAVRNHRPDVLGLSSLLTTTMGEQKIVIEALERESLRAAVKVLVGGGAVSRDWAREIGADGFGENAQEAVCAAKALLGLS